MKVKFKSRAYTPAIVYVASSLGYKGFSSVKEHEVTEEEYNKLLAEFPDLVEVVAEPKAEAKKLTKQKDKMLRVEEAKSEEIDLFSE